MNTIHTHPAPALSPAHCASARLDKMQRPTKSASKKDGAKSRQLNWTIRQTIDEIAFPPSAVTAIVQAVDLPLIRDLKQDLGVVQTWLREATKLLAADKDLPVKSQLEYLEQIRHHAEELERLTTDRFDGLSAIWLEAITRVDVNVVQHKDGSLSATRGAHPDLKGLRRTPLASAPPIIWPKVPGFMRRVAEREIARLREGPTKSADHNKRRFVGALAEAFIWLFGQRATVRTDEVEGYVGSPFATFVLAVHGAIPETVKPYVPLITVGQPGRQALRLLDRQLRREGPAQHVQVGHPVRTPQIQSG